MIPWWSVWIMTGTYLLLDWTFAREKFLNDLIILGLFSLGLTIIALIP